MYTKQSYYLQVATTKLQAGCRSYTWNMRYGELLVVIGDRRHESETKFWTSNPSQNKLYLFSLATCCHCLVWSAGLLYASLLLQVCCKHATVIGTVPSHTAMLTFQLVPLDSTLLLTTTNVFAMPIWPRTPFHNSTRSTLFLIFPRRSQRLLIRTSCFLHTVQPKWC